MDTTLDALEAGLNYLFQDRRLPLQALTHKSYSNEQRQLVPHNERLEFLGDAVLELVVSDLVYQRYPEIPEGGLTRLRAEVVSERGLSAVARQLRLGEGLRLGRGERKNGGSDKDSLLADALEALFGAVYLDGGFAAARQVIDGVLSPVIVAAARQRYGSDYKTCLQERLQSGFNQLPEYQLTEVCGPDHELVFHVEVRFSGQVLGRGSGASKKRAEQKAAAGALEHPLVRGLGVPS